MMSGCGILTNGKGTRREYCEFSLDELQVSIPLPGLGFPTPRVDVSSPFICPQKPSHAASLLPQEGDHIGLTRKSNNALHFYINGIDQGGCSPEVWKLEMQLYKCFPLPPPRVLMIRRRPQGLVWTTEREGQKGAGQPGA